MNLKKWMRLGGILAVLVGVAPMLAVAQEYRRDRAEERGAIRVDNNRPYYQRDYYRGSHHDNRGHYPEHSYRYNHDPHHGYQNR